MAAAAVPMDTSSAGEEEVELSSQDAEDRYVRSLISSTDGDVQQLGHKDGWDVEFDVEARARVSTPKQASEPSTTLLPQAAAVAAVAMRVVSPNARIFIETEAGSVYLSTRMLDPAPPTADASSTAPRRRRRCRLILYAYPDRAARTTFEAAMAAFDDADKAGDAIGFVRNFGNAYIEVVCDGGWLACRDKPGAELKPIPRLATVNLRELAAQEMQLSLHLGDEGTIHLNACRTAAVMAASLGRARPGMASGRQMGPQLVCLSTGVGGASQGGQAAVQVVQRWSMRKEGAGGGNDDDDHASDDDPDYYDPDEFLYDDDNYDDGDNKAHTNHGDDDDEDEEMEAEEEEEDDNGDDADQPAPPVSDQPAPPAVDPPAPAVDGVQLFTPAQAHAALPDAKDWQRSLLLQVAAALPRCRLVFFEGKPITGLEGELAPNDTNDKRREKIIKVGSKVRSGAAPPPFAKLKDAMDQYGDVVSPPGSVDIVAITSRASRTIGGIEKLAELYRGSGGDLIILITPSLLALYLETAAPTAAESSGLARHAMTVLDHLLAVVANEEASPAERVAAAEDYKRRQRALMANEGQHRIGLHVLLSAVLSGNEWLVDWALERAHDFGPVYLGAAAPAIVIALAELRETPAAYSLVSSGIGSADGRVAAPGLYPSDARYYMRAAPPVQSFIRRVLSSCRLYFAPPRRFDLQAAINRLAEDLNAVGGKYGLARVMARSAGGGGEGAAGPVRVAAAHRESPQEIAARRQAAASVCPSSLEACRAPWACPRCTLLLLPESGVAVLRQDHPDAGTSDAVLHAARAEEPAVLTEQEQDEDMGATGSPLLLLHVGRHRDYRGLCYLARLNAASQIEHRGATTGTSGMFSNATFRPDNAAGAAAAQDDLVVSAAIVQLAHIQPAWARSVNGRVLLKEAQRKLYKRLPMLRSAAQGAEDAFCVYPRRPLRPAELNHPGSHLPALRALLPAIADEDGDAIVLLCRAERRAAFAAAAEAAEAEDDAETARLIRSMR